MPFFPLNSSERPKIILQVRREDGGGQEREREEKYCLHRQAGWRRPETCQKTRSIDPEQVPDHSPGPGRIEHEPDLREQQPE